MNHSILGHGVEIYLVIVLGSVLCYFPYLPRAGSLVDVFHGTIFPERGSDLSLEIHVLCTDRSGPIEIRTAYRSTIGWISSPVSIAGNSYSNGDAVSDEV
jgi:hypothetical protein